MLRRALLRESLGFSNLCGSHLVCDLISIDCCELSTRQVCRCEVVPHICSHIVLRDTLSLGIQHPEGYLRPRTPLCRGLLIPLLRLRVIL